METPEAPDPMTNRNAPALLMILIALFVLHYCALPAHAQVATESLYFYDGSNQLEYICEATATNQRETNWLRSDSSLTSIVDAANVATVTTAAAHGLWIGAIIQVSGATVDTDLNMTTVKVASVPTPTTFTFATANVTDATYNESTLRIRTRVALTTMPWWKIKKFYYSGGNVIRSSWAHQSSAFAFACDSRTSYF